MTQESRALTVLAEELSLVPTAHIRRVVPAWVSCSKAAADLFGPPGELVFTVCTHTHTQWKIKELWLFVFVVAVLRKDFSV